MLEVGLGTGGRGRMGILPTLLAHPFFLAGGDWTPPPPLAAPGP